MAIWILSPDVNGKCCSCQPSVCSPCATCNTGTKLDPTVWNITGDCRVAFTQGQECELCSLFFSNFPIYNFIDGTVNNRIFQATSPAFNPAVSYLVEDELAPTVSQVVSYTYDIIDGNNNVAIEGNGSLESNIFTANTKYSIQSSATNGLIFKASPYTYSYSNLLCGYPESNTTYPALFYFAANFNSGDVLTIGITATNVQTCAKGSIGFNGEFYQHGVQCNSPEIGLEMLFTNQSATGNNNPNWISFQGVGYASMNVSLSSIYATYPGPEPEIPGPPIPDLEVYCQTQWFPPLTLPGSVCNYDGNFGLSSCQAYVGGAPTTTPCCINESYIIPNVPVGPAAGSSSFTFIGNNCVNVNVGYDGTPQQVNISIVDINGNPVDPISRFLTISFSPGYYTSCDGINSM